MSKLSKLQALVIDIDGVLWRGEKSLPGVRELFEQLKQLEIRFVLATNNATVLPESVCDRLQSVGVSVESDQIFTSAQATAEYLQAEIPHAATVLAIGEQALVGALRHVGFNLTGRADGVQAVVVGYDRQITWTKLAEATLAIRAGALFVGTNPDVTFPTERGLVPGAGALLAALKTSTGVEPVIVGKPEPLLYLQAMKRLGSDPKRSLALGDRLETDILGGQRAGMMTALVLTGVTRREDLDHASIKPDHVFADLFQLCAALEGKVM